MSSACRALVGVHPLVGPAPPGSAWRRGSCTGYKPEPRGRARAHGPEVRKSYGLGGIVVRAPGPPLGRIGKTDRRPRSSASPRAPEVRAGLSRVLLGLFPSDFFGERDVPRGAVPDFGGAMVANPPPDLRSVAHGFSFMTQVKPRTRIFVLRRGPTYLRVQHRPPTPGYLLRTNPERDHHAGLSSGGAGVTRVGACRTCRTVSRSSTGPTAGLSDLSDDSRGCARRLPRSGRDPVGLVGRFPGVVTSSRCSPDVDVRQAAPPWHPRLSC